MIFQKDRKGSASEAIASTVAKLICVLDILAIVCSCPALMSKWKQNSLTVAFYASPIPQPNTIA